MEVKFDSRRLYLGGRFLVEAYVSPKRLRYYVIRDAHQVADEQVRNGESSPVVWIGVDYSDAMTWMNRELRPQDRLGQAARTVLESLIAWSESVDPIFIDGHWWRRVEIRHAMKPGTSDSEFRARLGQLARAGLYRRTPEPGIGLVRVEGQP